MTVSELIEKLRQEDPDRDVYFEGERDSLRIIEYVETELKRDLYCSDGDHYVVVLS